MIGLGGRHKLGYNSLNFSTLLSVFRNTFFTISIAINELTKEGKIYFYCFSYTVKSVCYTVLYNFVRIFLYLSIYGAASVKNKRTFSYFTAWEYKKPCIIEKHD